MYYMLFTHDYVLYMDKLYVSFHVMHLYNGEPRK